eukprot:4270066-Pyramimonas_sp.AAC.1
MSSPRASRAGSAHSGDDSGSFTFEAESLEDLRDFYGENCSTDPIAASVPRDVGAAPAAEPFDATPRGAAAGPPTTSFMPAGKTAWNDLRVDLRATNAALLPGPGLHPA